MNILKQLNAEYKLNTIFNYQKDINNTLEPKKISELLNEFKNEEIRYLINNEMFIYKFIYVIRFGSYPEPYSMPSGRISYFIEQYFENLKFYLNKNNLKLDLFFLKDNLDLISLETLYRKNQDYKHISELGRYLNSLPTGREEEAHECLMLHFIEVLESIIKKIKLNREINNNSIISYKVYVNLKSFWLTYLK